MLPKHKITDFANIIKNATKITLSSPTIPQINPLENEPKFTSQRHQNFEQPLLKQELDFYGKKGFIFDSKVLEDIGTKSDYSDDSYDDDDYRTTGVDYTEDSTIFDIIKDLVYHLILLLELI